MRNIRSATPSDATAIRACLTASGLDAADIGDLLDDFLVAEEEGEVIGTIGLERYGTTGLLRSAAVLPAYRGGGTGGVLVDELEDRAVETGINELLLLTTTAEEFFVGKGYIKIERSSVQGAVLTASQFRGACPSTAVVMRKALVRERRRTSGTARANQ